MKKVNKQRIIYWAVVGGLAVLILASASGCGLLPISDAQIESIAQTTGKVAETGAGVGGRMLGLPAEVSGGISGVIGLGVVLGVRALLQSLQKKKEEHFVEVVTRKLASPPPPA